LDDLGCSGSESTLYTCSHSGTYVHNCGHSEDASAVWKCTTTDSGRLCVMIPGISTMLTLCVDNSDTEELLLLIKVHTLEKEQVLFY
jgi:hypothetical protein